MTDVLLNECGDIDYTDGRLTIVTGVDAIRQRWLIYIRTFLGEWFLDQLIGVPYYQRVLKKGVSRNNLKQVFKTATLGVPGVLQVVSVIVDSLDTATRQAEVTVTCIVTGDEGPETGVFKYTGSIPPEGCDIAPAAPLSVATAHQWYWFDPSDLDTVTTPSGLPYDPAQPSLFENKFTGMPGIAVGDGGTPPQILPALNGRKALSLLDGTRSFQAGFAAPSHQILALRESEGWDLSNPGADDGGGLTIFGVYQRTTTPSVSFDPLMVIDGVDVDGVTRRWLNVRIGRGSDDGTLRLRIEQDTVAGLPVTEVGGLGPGNSATNPFVFALRLSLDVSTHFEVWANGTLIMDDFPTDPTPTMVQGTGKIGFNAYQDGAGALSYDGPLLVGDVIGYSRKLDDTEIAAVFAYLLPKWGI